MRLKSSKKLNNIFTESFKCSINGIKVCFKSERNFKLHLLAMIIVIVIAILLKISFNEWIILIILFSLVLSAEMINSCLENIVDLVTDEITLKVKTIKDIAAGAVLIIAFACAMIGLIIFVPKIINLIFS